MNTLWLLFKGAKLPEMKSWHSEKDDVPITKL